MEPESISLPDVTESKYNEQQSLNAPAAQEKGNAFEDRMKLYKERLLHIQMNLMSAHIVEPLLIFQLFSQNIMMKDR